MSDLLSIGASGVRAYQTALTTVSENIANSGNAAYARRTANVSEAAVFGVGARTINGQGAVVRGVARASDPYTEGALRTANTDLARTQASSMWLTRIEGALTGASVTQQVTAFFAAGTSLAAEPTSTALRAGMLSAAESVATAFGATARSLDQASMEVDDRAGVAVGELNRLTQGLLKVNQGLGRTPAGGAAAAQLADQRDQLLEQISSLADINVSLDGVGRAIVRAGGSAGPMLVDAREAGEVGFARAGGATAVTIMRADGVASFAPAGGALGGLVEGAQRISAAREQLDTIATDFVEDVNTLQRAGDDLDGQAGQPLFAVTGSPSDFAVNIDDGRAIAAASRGAGPRNASNLGALAALRTTAGFEGGLTAMVTDNAATLKQRSLVAAAQSAILDGAVTARSEVSGVNLDSEAVDLVRFQQAYQASSRVIQVARETLQSLLDIR